MGAEKCIQILNGPNLNLLGLREPEIYGNKSFDEFYEYLKEAYPEWEIRYAQSNHEGDLIDIIQMCGREKIPVILNAGGYTHSSVALGDAIRSAQTKVIEVHISQIYSREEFRHHSFISPEAIAVISGLGLYGYEAAVAYLVGKHQP